MQTIALEFKKLDKLPVPTSANEMLCCKDADGDIYCFQALRNKGAGTFMFICDLEEGFTYCHLKVTAKTEPEFKVGDRVKWEHREAEVVRILQDTKEALIEYSVKVSVMGFVEYNDHETIVPLTDLTLITE